MTKPSLTVVKPSPVMVVTIWDGDTHKQVMEKLDSVNNAGYKIVAAFAHEEKLSEDSTFLTCVTYIVGQR